MNEPKPTNFLGLIIFAVLGAVAVIGVVVILTPMDDEVLEEELAETTPPATESAAPKAPQYQRVSIASLKLPTAAEQFDVAATRKDLIEVAQTLSSKYGDDPTALHIAAQIYAELKMTKEASDIWTKCVAMKPLIAGPYAGYAQILSDSGIDTEAIKVVQSALSQGVESSELSVILGSAYENQGELEKASEVLDLASRRYPDDPSVLVALGRVQNQTQAFAAAEVNLKKAIELGEETVASLSALANALARQSKIDEAKQIQTKLASMQKTQQPANESNADDASFQADYEAAFKRIAHRCILAAGSVAEGHGDFDAAESMVRTAVKMSPDQLQSYMALSSIYRNQMRLPEALAVHEILLAKQPENAFNAVNLAAVAMSMEEFELADQTLQAAIQREPENTVVQVAIAKLKLNQGKFAEARDMAARIVTNSPSAETYALLATAYAGAGQQDAAAAAWQKAQSLDPANRLFQGAPGGPGLPMTPLAEPGNP